MRHRLPILCAAAAAHLLGLGVWALEFEERSGARRSLPVEASIAPARAEPAWAPAWDFFPPPVEDPARPAPAETPRDACFPTRPGERRVGGNEPGPVGAIPELRIPLVDWGGAGGLFGARGGHRNLKANGGGKRTEAAMEAGLDWLARNPDAGGGWGEDTGIVLLAFLGAGESHREGRHREEVSRALRPLLRARPPLRTVGLAIRTNVFAEVYASTGSPWLRRAARSGVRRLLAAQRPFRGFPRERGDRNSDVAATAWAVIALKSARATRIEVPDAELEDAEAWLRDRAIAGEGCIRAPGGGASPLLTAQALFARELCSCSSRRSPAMPKGRRSPTLLSSTDLVLAEVEAGRVGDEDLWYFATNALGHRYFCSRKGVNPRKVMNRAIYADLLPRQREDGSFAPAGDGSRVAATALMTMCLQTYYRYAQCY